ncbi:MAG: fasciclin domain-containing protein [Candidatus Hydrogenedentes bacterium]|nr:fasciclin domain-containing protein [Candidatus Hydrogenedentota bacterium]
MTKVSKWITGAAVAVAAVSAPLNVAQAAEEKTIVETAVAAGDFGTLVAAVKAAGLAETLSGAGPFTVFAPTDAAFAKLPAGTVEALLANPEKLKSILLFHVVSGKVMAKDVTGLKSAPTVFGQDLAVDASDGVKINGATVTAADIICSNGVIHVIDTVLLPKNVVEIAAGNEDFSTLVAAVTAAGLAETLSGEGPFTIFAPTNEAFAKLPAGTVEDLLKPENKAKLAAILTYHVVPGKVMAADVAGLSKATTVQGGDVSIKSKRDTVTINGAKVTATDIVGTNGVIHVIDTVILPG